MLWMISALIFLLVSIVTYAIVETSQEAVTSVKVPDERFRKEKEEKKEASMVYQATLPIIQFFGHVNDRCLSDRFRRTLQDKLVKAGLPGGYNPFEYIGMCQLAALIGYVFCSFLFSLYVGGISWLPGVLPGLLVFYFAYSWLDSTIEERTRKINSDLSYLLDLISLTMDAGATFDEALQIATEEMDDGALKTEMEYTLSEIDMGTNRRDALQRFADRIDSEKVDTMVTSVLQSEDFGTSLKETLMKQADQIRFQRSKDAEKQAARARVKLLFPTILIMFSVLLIIFGPVILQVLREGTF